jgi:integrase
LRVAGLGAGHENTFHDLRRTYACERMRALEPHRGRLGAAVLVSRELGHNRTEVLEWYIDFDAGEAA